MLQGMITPEMHYDDWAKAYDSDVEGWDYYAPDRLLDRVGHFIHQQKDTPAILDVGIGTGILSERLRSLGRDMYIAGIDVSRKMLQFCAEKGVANELKRLDVSEDPFPFADNSFDVVAATGVMENIQRIAHTLEEMARVVRPGGLVAFTYVPTLRLQESVALKWRPGRNAEGKFVVGKLMLHKHNPALTKTYAAGAGIKKIDEESFTGYRAYVLMAIKYNLFIGKKSI